MFERRIAVGRACNFRVEVSPVDVGFGNVDTVNREHAIAWLRSVGRNASARDWNMGETIVVFFGEPTTTTDGIVSYPGAVHLCPAAEGSWQLFDFSRRDPVVRDYASLELAVIGAHEYIAAIEVVTTSG
jgi:hypothetical protein